MPAAAPSPAAQFAANVVRCRERREWTKEQAAWACGMDPTAYGRIESGERKPTLLTIFKLARGLDVEPAEFFVGTGRG